MFNFKHIRSLILLAFLSALHVHANAAQRNIQDISISPVYNFTITLRQTYVDPTLGKWPIKRTPAQAVLVEYYNNILLLPRTTSSILLEVEEVLSEEEGSTCVFTQMVQPNIQQVQLPSLEPGRYLLRIHLEEKVYEGLFNLP